MTLITVKHHYYYYVQLHSNCTCVTKLYTYPTTRRLGWTIDLETVKMMDVISSL